MSACILACDRYGTFLPAAENMTHPYRLACWKKKKLKQTGKQNLADLCHSKWQHWRSFLDTGTLTAKACKILWFSLCNSNKKLTINLCLMACLNLYVCYANCLCRALSTPRFFMAPLSPTWKCSHLLHTTTQVLASSFPPSAHIQFFFFLLPRRNSITTVLFRGGFIQRWLIYECTSNAVWTLNVSKQQETQFIISSFDCNFAPICLSQCVVQMRFVILLQAPGICLRDFTGAV